MAIAQSACQPQPILAKTLDASSDRICWDILKRKKLVRFWTNWSTLLKGFSISLKKWRFWFFWKACGSTLTMSTSQTISEKFKINRFVSSIYSPRGNKIIFKNYFITSWGIDWKDKTVNFEFLRDGLRYHHQIFTSSLTLWEPALYQIWRA